MKKSALLLCALIGLPAYADQEKMAFALFSKDYPALLQLAEPLAKNEDCGALYYLGRYFEEEPVQQRTDKAIASYSRVVANPQCAKQNIKGWSADRHAKEAPVGVPFLSVSAEAAERIASRFHRGDHMLNADPAKAAQWWQRAEKYGSFEADYRLGLLYLAQGESALAFRYLHKHLELIEAIHAHNPWVQRIETRDTNYALGKLYLETGSSRFDRDKAIHHLRDAAVLNGIEPSYLLALLYAQRDPQNPFIETPGRPPSSGDLGLAVAFLEPAINREVAPPHLRFKRVLGQLLLADLIFHTRPEHSRALIKAAFVQTIELDAKAQREARAQLSQLKRKWSID